MTINGTNHSTAQWLKYAHTRHDQFLREAQEARLLAPRAEGPSRWHSAVSSA